MTVEKTFEIIKTILDNETFTNAEWTELGQLISGHIFDKVEFLPTLTIPSFTFF